MKEKIERLTAENNEQRVIIANLNEKLNPKDILSAVESSPVDILVMKETMNHDPEEDKKFLKLIKSIDEANAKKNQPAQKKKKTAKKSKKAKKVVTAAAVEEKEDVVETVVAKKKAPAKRKKKSPASKMKTTPKVDDIVAEGASEDAVNGLDSVEQAYFMEALAEIAEEAADDLKDVDSKTQDLLMNDISNVQKEIEEILGKENVSFAKDSGDNGEDTKSKEKKVKKKKKTVKKKKAATVKATVKVNDVDDADANSNPWGGLKQSTLQRKTIAQLTAYLQERVRFHCFV